jgi:hypothetical protein
MDITSRLRGKRVASVMANGHILSLRLETGEEVNIAWLDDNGVPLKGSPAVQSTGARLLTRNLHDLIHAPKH